MLTGSLALECPTSMLDRIQPLADFDWILAHRVLSDSKYASFYKESKRVKILDNGVNELDNPLTIEGLISAANIVEPTYIVPPDYFQDLEETLHSINQFVDRFGVDKLFPVVQGENFLEFDLGLKVIKDIGFKHVAIPWRTTGGRDTPTDRLISGRQIVLSIAVKHFSRIHLLGMIHPDEFCRYRSIKGVEYTVDTGRPVMCGLEGVMFSRDKFPPKSKPSSSADHLPLTEVAYRLVEHNVNYIRAGVDELNGVL